MQVPTNSSYYVRYADILYTIGGPTNYKCVRACVPRTVSRPCMSSYDGGLLIPKDADRRTRGGPRPLCTAPWHHRASAPGSQAAMARRRLVECADWGLHWLCFESLVQDRAIVLRQGH
jgi:hypothetical protein